MTALTMTPDSGEQHTLDVTLAPGDFYFGNKNARIYTLLGSCVAITLWHPLKKIGGMCHYLLPTRSNKQRLGAGYYADDVMILFLKHIRQANSSPSEYQVKLFGGANMFTSFKDETSQINVAQNNIQAGLSLLRDQGFNIVNTDVGGDNYRKVYLELWSGNVWVQYGIKNNMEIK